MAGGLLDIGRFLRSGRAWRVELALLAMVAVLLGLTALAGYWLLATTRGAEWLLARVDGVTVDGLRGSLLGPLALRRLRIVAGDRVIVVEGLDVDWRPAALREGRLDIRRLVADSVEIASPRSDEPPEMPATLELPLAGVVADLRIGELRLVAAEDGAVRFAASAIAARGDSDGRRHRVHELRATHEYGTLAGAGEVSALPPFAVRAAARLEGRGDAAGERPVLEAQVGGSLDALSVQATGRGGGFSGSGDAQLRPFARFPLAALRVALAEFDPHAFAPTLPHARLTVGAELGALADGRMAGPVRLRNAAPAAFDRGGLPLTAAAAMMEVGADGNANFTDLELALAGGGRIAGSAGWRQSERAGTADLRIERLNLAALDTRLLATRLAGSATLVGGAESQRGRLTLADARLRIDADFARAGDELTLERLRARLGRNRLDAEGRFGGRGNRLRLAVEAPDMAAVGPGFGGELSARAELVGSLAQPQASVSARARNLVLLSAHRLAGMALDGELRGKDVRLALDIDGYRRDGEATLSRLSATLDGHRGSHRLRLHGELAAGRRVALRASGGLLGDYERWRDLRWRGRIEEFDAVLPVALRLLSPAPLLLARERVELGAATFAAGGGRLEHDASSWTPAAWRSRGRFGGVGLRLAGGEVPAGGESLRLGGTWDVAAAGVRLDGRLEVARESGDWIVAGEPPLALGISDFRLSATARGERIEARLLAAGERLGNWRGEVTMTLPAQRAALELPPATRLDGRIAVDLGDIGWLGAMAGGDIVSDGRLDADLALGGTLGAPDWRGRMRGRELAVAMSEYGVRLEGGELAAVFDAARVRVERLRFAAPHAPPAGVPIPFPARAGTLEGSGEIDLQARTGRLEFSAGRVPLVQRTDRWVVVSGRGGVDFGRERLAVLADAVADVGYVAEPPASRPQVSADVVVIGRRAPPAGPRFELVADVDLGRHFRVRAAGLDGRLAGSLRIVGEPERMLRATGSIATADATFAAYGQQLAVERGIVNFQGPIDDPGLNVLALRKGLAVEAGVAVTGTAKAPQVRLVSAPPVPDPEKLSWIVLGHAPEAGSADSGLLLAAAGALLGGQSGAGPTGQLAQAFGVDELSLRSAPGAETVTGQIVSVGKRLSSRATLGYEQGLSAAAGAMKLTWQLTPRVSLVTRAGADNAIDVNWTFSFD